MPIAALLDESLSPEALGGRVERVAGTQASDGIELDAQGNLYITALEDNAIKVLRPDGRLEVFAEAPELRWPDTISISPAGDFLFSASQFHRMPAFNGDVDKRIKPYEVFRLPMDRARQA